MNFPSVCPLYPGCFVWGASLNSCGTWFPKSCLFTQFANTQIPQWLRRRSFPNMWWLKLLVGWWVVRAKVQDSGAPLTPLLPLDHFFVWFQSYWLIQHLSIASWHQEVNTKYQNMKLNSYNPALRHFIQTAYFQFQRDVRKIWKSYFRYFVTFYMDDIFLSISE